MKSVLRCIALLLILAITLCGCGTQEPEIPLADTALPLLQAAYAKIDAAGEYHIIASIQKQIVIESEVLTENRTQKISCKDFGKPSVTLSAKETLTIGKLEYSQSKYYSGGVGYLMLEEDNFTSACKFEEFSAGLIPIKAIDIDRYSDISATVEDGNYVIAFRSPTEAEEWAMTEGSKLQSACGYATITPEGELLELRYELTAQAQQAQIQLTATITPQDATPVAINLPEASACMRIKSLRSAEELERVCAVLQQAGNISSVTDSVMESEAFGIHRSQNTNLLIRTTYEEFSADVITNVSQVDTSKGSDAAKMSQTEHFQSEIYTVSVDGQAPTQVPGVTTDAMKSYCQDILLGNILIPQYINGASVSKGKESTTYTFNATKELATIIFSNVSQTLYEDSMFLENVSTSVETKEIKCYITVQHGTGLLLSVGMNYEAEHVIDEATYKITYNYEQSYTVNPTE